MEQIFTFDQLPEAVSQLGKKLDQIERLILQSSSHHTQSQIDQYIKIEEAAEILGLAVPTIRSKMCRGELPYMKKGKRVYFSRQELMEYIRQGRRKTNSEIQGEVNQYLSPKQSNQQKF